MHRRRALAREHDEASRAAARRDRLARQLAVIDETLAHDVQPLLGSLPTARRCRSKWDDMPGGDACRRCARCGHDVHDLSRMTRLEVDALLAGAQGALRRRSDGRVVAAACPAEPPSLLARVASAGIAGAVAGGAMTLALGPAPAETLSGSEGVLAARAGVSAALPPPPAVVRVEALRSEPRVEVTRAEDAVRLLGPSTYEIDRARFEALLGGHGERSVRVVPHQHRGEILGVRVYGVRRGSELYALGLRSGDVIADVNGRPIGYPDQALEAYAHLRDRDLFVVRILREGEERVHVYHVRGAS